MICEIIRGLAFISRVADRTEEMADRAGFACDEAPCFRGKLYRIRPERSDGVLADIEPVPFKDAPGLRLGLPDELEN